jgi:hypothetical protein
MSVTRISDSLLSPLQQQQQSHRTSSPSRGSPSSSSSHSDRMSIASSGSNKSNGTNRGSKALYNTMNPANLQHEEGDEDSSYYAIKTEDSSNNGNNMGSPPGRMFRTLLHRAGQIKQERNNGSGRHEQLMTLALFATYFAVMGAKCALPSTFALITSDESGLLLPTNVESSAQQIMAKVLTLSTFAIAFGKFLLGPIIDNYGGIFCLKVALSALMGLLAIISSANTFRTFAICWVGVDFIFSSCWAACLNAIHQSFTRNKWASSIGQLAAAARIGNASSFFFFAWLLQVSQQRRINTGGLVGQSWRNIFWTSAMMQIVPIALLCISGRTSRDERTNHSISETESLPSLTNSEDEIISFSTGITNTKTSSSPSLSSRSTKSFQKSITVLRKESKTITFWMHLISRSCLMIIASFLLFVPSYMTNAFGLSSASASRVGSLYALGCLLSVTVCSKRFSDLDKWGKVVSSVGFLGLVILISILQLLHVSNIISIGALGGSICMFLWGAGFAIPFYIPPSLYALKQGGSDSSATSKYHHY